jgi:hypothetical protein
LKAKARTVRSLKRREAFRVQPPGAHGRPRENYPPVCDGYAWSPTLLKTIRARSYDHEHKRGAYAVLRHGDTYEVWSNDERIARDLATRREAFARARSDAFWFDLDAHHRETDPELKTDAQNCMRLTSEEMCASGRRLDGEDGDIWRSLTGALAVGRSSPHIRYSGDTRTFSIKETTLAWCEASGIAVELRTLVFAKLRKKTHRLPLFTHVLVFESDAHAVMFQFRWRNASDI